MQQLGFVWNLRAAKKAQSAEAAKKTQSAEEKKETKKAPPKKRKRRDITKPKEPDISKIPTSTTKTHVETKALPDGTQVIGTVENIHHPDGSKVEIDREESIQKRTLRLENGTRVLEITTKTVTTKVERVVLPTATAIPEPGETNKSKKEDSQSLENKDGEPAAKKKAAEDSAKKSQEKDTAEGTDNLQPIEVPKEDKTKPEAPKAKSESESKTSALKTEYPEETTKSEPGESVAI